MRAKFPLRAYKSPSRLNVFNSLRWAFLFIGHLLAILFPFPAHFLKGRSRSRHAPRMFVRVVRN